jgi:DNA-directed RNA polymerase beta' subunit
MNNNKQSSGEELDVHSHVPLIHKKQTINIKIMSNEIKQTAVEQLAEKLLSKYRLKIDTYPEFQQAKEMEKKQIVDGIVETMTKKFRTYTESGLEHFIEIAEQHYNETYGGNK